MNSQYLIPESQVQNDQKKVLNCNLDMIVSFSGKKLIISNNTYILKTSYQKFKH